MEDIYTGRRVLIRLARNGQKLADTTVLRCDPNIPSIFVRASALSERGNFSVTLDIPEARDLSECKGIMKNAREGEVEIRLMDRRHVNYRSSPRYAIHAAGLITHVLTDGEAVALDPPVEARALNMSTGGILISSQAGALRVGQNFHMQISLSGSGEVIMECCVVRTQNSGSVTEEYGCRITGIWKAAPGGPAVR